MQFPQTMRAQALWSSTAILWLLLLLHVVTVQSCGKPWYPPDVSNMMTRDGGIKVNPISLIVGGQEVIPHSWPWMAALFQKTSASWWFVTWQQFCGGTIIAPNWVMTAAHCFYGETDLSKFKIVLGAHDKNVDETSQTTVGISQIIIHPNYYPHNYTNDIALLKLDQALWYDPEMSSVCLPGSSDRVANGTTGVVTGWGATLQGASTSDVLMQVVLPVIDGDECMTAYPQQIDDSTMMCALLPHKDSCQGDSGGPFMFINAAGQWVQEGIVSWGTGCGDPQYPGVYTRVAAFRQFIDTTMANN